MRAKGYGSLVAVELSSIMHSERTLAPCLFLDQDQMDVLTRVLPQNHADPLALTLLETILKALLPLCLIIHASFIHTRKLSDSTTVLTAISVPSPKVH